MEDLIDNEILDVNVTRLKGKLLKEIKNFSKQKPELTTVQVINSVLFGMIVENLLGSMTPEEVRETLINSVDDFVDTISAQ